MKNKILAILLAIVLVGGIILGIVLPKVLKKNEGVDANYNIIFTNSTVPPTLASMDSIIDGGETYAYIQRGKTFSGIGELKNDGFINFGFDTNKQENNLTPDKVQDFVALVKRLKADNKKAKFTIYVTDFDAYAGFAIGIYAGLSDEDFKVVMIEDGSSTYSNFYNQFISGKNVLENQDQPYEAFEELLNTVTAVVNKMKEDSKGALPGGDMMLHKPEAVYALATLSNAEYRLQDIDKIKTYLDQSIRGSRLTNIYNGTDESISVNIKSSSVSQTLEEFTAEQKSKYLTLVLGSKYKDDSTEMLTRTIDANEQQVSESKLIFIGSRAYNYDYGMVDNIYVSSNNQQNVENYEKYIVEYTQLQTLAAQDDKLAKVLTELYNEEDWTALKSKMSASYSDAWALAFDRFIEYRYTFSWLLKYYGGTTAEGKYDILYKGHPSELVDDGNTFQDKHYTTNGTKFTQEMFTLVNQFHFNDSVGKKIGVLPGGVSVENFAFLGIDFSICGLDSSSYTGFATYIPVEFVMGSGNYTIFSQNLIGRYNAGTLLDSKEQTTLVLNKGNLLKLLGRQEEYKNWVASTYGIDTAIIDNYDIDSKGMLIYSESYKESQNLADNIIRKNVEFGYYDSENSYVSLKVLNDVENGAHLSSLEKPEIPLGIIPEGYSFAGWSFVGQSNLWNDYINSNTNQIQFYARFSKTLTLNSNYPSVEADKQTKYNITLYSDVEANLTTIEVLKYEVEGYDFVGWATTSGAEEAQYSDGEKLPKGVNISDLYAVWTKKV